jgi:hypothetical protein
VKVWLEHASATMPATKIHAVVFVIVAPSVAPIIECKAIDVP